LYLLYDDKKGISIVREPFLQFMDNQLAPGIVLIACGLPASYKTETTGVIARLKGYYVLRTDMIRLEVLKDEDMFDEKVASNMNKRNAIYDEMFRMADELTGRRKGIILDATFITQKLRKRAAEIAFKHNNAFVIQQTVCPQQISISRILKRTKENFESNALTEQAYLNNQQKFESVDIYDLLNSYPGLNVTHLVVDTTSDFENEWIVINKTCR
jgi:predicted kinase